MLLVYVVIASVLIGYITGGRLRNYSNKPFRKVLLPVFAFFIEAMIGPLDQLLHIPTAQWLGWLVLLEYIMLFIFLIYNYRYRGIELLALSTVTNFAVIAANDYRMPVSPVIFKYPELMHFVERIQNGSLPEYTLVDYDGPLWYLGDTIPMFGGLASMGDLIMAMAVMVIVLTFMHAKPAEKIAPLD